ncbi:unnamed protein product, partial [Candidula unifasciata]
MEDSDTNMNSEQTNSSAKFSVRFLGSMPMNRLYSQTMQPWVMAEIHRQKKCIQEDVGENPLLFEHSLRSVTRFAKLHQDPKCFGYLTRDQLDVDFVCHVYLADCEAVVKFVGRVKVGGKKVTSDDIDRLAEKIITELEKRELEKIKREEEVLKERRRRHASEASIGSFSDTMEDADEELTPLNKTETQKDMLETPESSLPQGGYNTEAVQVDRPDDVDGSFGSSSHSLAGLSLKGSRSRHSSTSDSRRGSTQEVLFGRQRLDSSSSHESVGSVHPRQEVGQAMVLKIGQQGMTMISLDKKKVFLEFNFKDISSVSQGSRRQDMFGIVARESESRFTCYLLRCLSGSVVAEIMSTLQMAFATAYNKRGTTASTTATTAASHHQICTSCPLYQIHRICQDINAMPSQAAYDLLVKKVQLLPDHELNELNSLMQAEEPESFEESVEVMVSFLRHLCERKQKEHVHISETSKSSKAGVNTLEDKHNLFEGLRSKAKKSFTTSFENLLNRGKKKEDGCRTVSWTTDSDASYASRVSDSSATSTPEASPMSKEFHHSFPSPPTSPGAFRHRSATCENLGSSPHSDMQPARRRDVNHNTTSTPVKNVIISGIIGSQFSDSVSSSCVSSPQDNTTVVSSLMRRPSSSWRKAIFNRVCTPQHSWDYGDDEQSVGKLHDTEEIRTMWKKAFLETLLLIRLEKEYHSIREYFVFYGSQSVVVFR